MKVLHIISSKGFFGAENVLVQLCQQLKAIQCAQPIAGVIKNLKTPHTEVATICDAVGVETIIFPCRYKADYRTWLEIRKYIADNNIDIVHSHGYKSNIYAFISTIGTQTKLVSTCHNWINNSKKLNFYTSLDLLFLKKFNCVVAVSNEVRKRIEKAGVSKSNVKLVNNGITFSKRKNIVTGFIEESFGIPHDAVIVGCVGRISKEKGQKFLLKITSEIIRNHPDVYFLIIGDGDLKQELEQEYASSNIIFTGFRDDVKQLYPYMDIFVLPSLTEGMPMVLLEAMSCSIPVIATSVGAIPSIISSSVNGMLISPGSETALKRALIYLIENKAEADRIGTCGYNTIKNKFSADVMASNYMKIYTDLLSGV